ncbi:MAG: uracil-DNA glycosylase, partial [Rhodoferax sp.]|nr:uracil-DNA glycosylase [Rhodoferax sp.]
MSLDLDARQRAMLEEMHIHVWWPKAVELPAEPAAAAVLPATSAPVAVAPQQQVKSPPRMAPVNIADAMADAPELAAATARVAAPQKPVVARALPAGPIDTMDWATLQEAVAGCMACPLGQGRKNAVFGVGPASEDGQPPRADWLIVGESPGEDAEAQGEPFVGQAGKLLDNMLKAIGVSRHGSADGLPHKAACIVNLLKCRPPGSRNP